MLKRLTIALTVTAISLASIGIPSVLGTQSARAISFGWHPFPALSILWYQIFAPGADNNGVFVGGAQGIEQGGGHDDCWYESAVASLARNERGARLLSDMIERSPSGGYIVTFLDKPDNTYAVTEADVTADHIKDNAKWADILEAGLFKRFPALLNGQAGDTKVLAEMGGGRGLGLTILTGHQASVIDTDQTDQATISETLQRNMMMNIATTAGTRSKETPEVVVPNHCYSVLAYDATKMIVTLRNPWGKNTSTKYLQLPQTGQTKAGVTDIGSGLIQMDVPHFAKYYQDLSYCRIHHL